jgi:hypothetical protein
LLASVLSNISLLLLLASLLPTISLLLLASLLSTISLLLLASMLVDVHAASRVHADAGIPAAIATLLLHPSLLLPDTVQVKTNVFCLYGATKKETS